MERIELFKTTMDVLWKAYSKGHLIHDHACGCAVGNLVCNATNKPMFFKRTSKNYRNGQTAWLDVVGAHLYDETRDVYMGSVAKKQIAATGYTPKEISLIEHAFEDKSNYPIHDLGDPTGKRGFINVLKVLGEIHKAPKVAKCLIKHVKDGTYKYETSAFKEATKSKKVKTKFGEMSIIK